jgi:hypothetical protein
LRNTLITADRDKLVCANYMHWLVRENSPTSWPAAQFNTFTAAPEDVLGELTQFEPVRERG